MCRFYSCLSNGILDWKFQFILSKCCVRKDKNTLKIIKRKCAHSSVCSICWASKNKKIMTASKITLRFCYNHEKNLYFLVSNMCKFQWFKRFNTSSIFATLKWILQNVTIIFLLQFFLYEIFVVLTKIASFKIKKRERNICITYVKKTFRSSRPEVFLVKGVLEMCSRFTGEHLLLGTPLDGCFWTLEIKSFRLFKYGALTVYFGKFCFQLSLRRDQLPDNEFLFIKNFHSYTRCGSLL